MSQDQSRQDKNEIASNDVEDATPRLPIPLSAALVRRMENLARAPEFNFVDLEDFVRAALYSFVAFKEQQLERIRQERVAWR